MLKCENRVPIPSLASQWMRFLKSSLIVSLVSGDASFFSLSGVIGSRHLHGRNTTTVAVAVEKD